MLAKTKTNWLGKAYFHQRFALGESRYTATLFGQPKNWSLAQLSHEDPAVREEFGARLGGVLYELQVGSALAPNPTKFTDRIIDASELATRVAAGSATLRRNPEQPADGVPLEPGDAFVISTANCPVTLMERGGAEALALHTGRECLIDRILVDTGRPAPGRSYHSICFSGLVRLGDPKSTKVKVFWAEPAHRSRYDQDDPTYGSFNSKLYGLIVERWGRVCVPRQGRSFNIALPELIKAQCMEMGVPAANIDLSHGHQPMNGTHLDGTPGKPRNLFVLARRS